MSACIQPIATHHYILFLEKLPVLGVSRYAGAATISQLSCLYVHADLGGKLSVETHWKTGKVSRFVCAALKRKALVEPGAFLCLVSSLFTHVYSLGWVTWYSFVAVVQHANYS